MVRIIDIYDQDYDVVIPILTLHNFSSSAYIPWAFARPLLYWRRQWWKSKRTRGCILAICLQ